MRIPALDLARKLSLSSFPLILRLALWIRYPMSEIQCRNAGGSTEEKEAVAASPVPSLCFLLSRPQVRTAATGETKVSLMSVQFSTERHVRRAPPLCSIAAWCLFNQCYRGNRETSTLTPQRLFNLLLHHFIT